MFKRQYHRTTIVAVCSIFILVGVAISYRYIILLPTICLAFGIILPLVKNRNVVALILVSLLGFMIGVSRGSYVKQKLALYNQFYGKKIIIHARSLDDGVYTDKGQVEFNADNIKVYQGGNEVKLPGKILVRGYGESTVNRYDNVKVEGKMMPSKSGSRQAGMLFSRIEIISRHTSTPESIRKRFNNNMQNALPEPLSSFALGLLVGQKTTLNKTVSDELSTIGLSHVIAVSGYNLTIIVGFIMRLLRGRSKYQMLALSLLSIGLFLLITGSSPSIVRAAWVSGLSLLAWYYGRIVKPYVLVLITAAVTALANPLYVYGDLGWYLSVLAFFGILCLAPPIHTLLFSGKNMFARYIIECICAQVMTLPLTIFVFGKMATLGLISNVLIAPLVPLAMVLSLVAAVARGLSHILALFALPAKLILTFMLDMVHVCASFKGTIILIRISKTTMTVLYIALCLVSCVLYVLSRRKSQKIVEYC